MTQQFPEIRSPGLSRHDTGKRIRRVLAVIAGMILILVGIMGVVLPFLPGWVLIGSGIILVWPKSRLAAWLKHLPLRLKEWYARKRRS